MVFMINIWRYSDNITIYDNNLIRIELVIKLFTAKVFDGEAGALYAQAGGNKWAFSDINWANTYNGYGWLIN